MYGFHKNKRIVLFDTLLEDYTPVGRKDNPEVVRLLIFNFSFSFI